MNRIGNALFAAVLAAAAGAGTWYLMKSGTLESSTGDSSDQPLVTSSGMYQPMGEAGAAAKAVLRPKPSDTGPHPKVAISGREFKFGTMAVMEKRSHTFVIRNEGEATLKLDAGTPTCKCTDFDIKQKSLEPGEETEVFLEWVPKSESDNFRQHAPIFTNDPDYYPQPLKLVIQGQVLRYLGMLPEGNWDLGTLSEKNTNMAAGTIFSRLWDTFEITNIQKSNEALTVVKEPMTDIECRQESVKCGYRMKIQIDAGQAPIGSIDETVTFNIDKDPEKRFTIFVRGRRSGPVQFFPKGRGATWSRKDSILRFGEFRAREGKRAELLMFISSAADFDASETKIESITVEPPLLSLDITPTPNWRVKDRKRFDVVVEAKPGIRAGAFDKTKPLKVTIQTNHTTLKEVKFDVYFVAT